MNQMGTTDTWISCCTQAEPAVLCRERGPRPSLVLSLPDPSLPFPSLPAPAWLPGLGEPTGLPGHECHSLFVLYLGLAWERRPREAEHRSGCGSWGEPRHCPSLHSGPPWCSRAAWAAPTFIPCLLVFPSQRIPDWCGVGDLKAHLVQPPFTDGSVLQLLELIPIPSCSSLLI